ncbi:MAG TPA: hypothetical protein VHS31_15040 [Tepidisphaeraceae bacterium]|jgi:hypothetical protein|nr:hypothetical protein [Tepidisphaeraceae bacterium]
MTRDELEFAISRYIDGTLNPLEQSTIEEILASDASARALLDEYRRLDAVVKTAMPLPEIAWDQFAAGISQETAKCDVSVKHYQLAAWTKVVSLAAMIAIAFGVAFEMRHRDSSISDVQTGSVAVNSTPVDVEISAPTAVAAAPVNDITIGQPSGFAAANFRGADSIISAPSSIWIASGEGSQDTDPSLY